MNYRTLQRIIPSIPTSDGAGVKLRRSLGQSPDARLDPFLMLDEFSTDDADDYIAGFPSHPHRGFETVTYMLDGHMLHEDHLGNAGELKSGGVQWMTAGRGIIHSEMPQQAAGAHARLPAVDQPAGAREDEAGGLSRHPTPARSPWSSSPAAASVKVIAGTLRASTASAAPGPIQGVSPPIRCTSTSRCRRARASRTPVRAGTTRSSTCSKAASAIGCRRRTRRSPRTAPACSSDGDASKSAAAPEGGRFLLLAGRPLREPVVAVRAVRDEHARGDRAGDPRLPERRADERRRADPAARVERSETRVGGGVAVQVTQRRVIAAPTRVSHSFNPGYGSHAERSGRRRCQSVALLERAADAHQRRFGERRADQLHADRQARGRESGRQRQRAGAEVVGRARERRERRGRLVDFVAPASR